MEARLAHWEMSVAKDLTSAIRVICCAFAQIWAKNSCFYGMFGGQGLHPTGQEQVNLLKQGIIQYPAQNVGDVLSSRVWQSTARQPTPYRLSMSSRMAWARGEDGSAEFNRIRKGLPSSFSSRMVRSLRLQIVLPGNIGDGAVGGDHNADGGVLGDDFPGADLCRFGHGDLVVKPGVVTILG